MTHEQNVTGLETCSLISREVLAQNVPISVSIPSLSESHEWLRGFDRATSIEIRLGARASA